MDDALFFQYLIFHITTLEGKGRVRVRAGLPIVWTIGFLFTHVLAEALHFELFCSFNEGFQLVPSYFHFSTVHELNHGIHVHCLGTLEVDEWMRVGVFFQDCVENRGGRRQNQFVSINGLFITSNCDIAEVAILSQSLESVVKALLVLLPLQMIPLVPLHHINKYKPLRRILAFLKTVASK